MVREEELPDELAEREFEARALTLLTELTQRIQAMEARLEDLPAQVRSRMGESEAQSGYRGSSMRQSFRAGRPSATGRATRVRMPVSQQARTASGEVSRDQDPLRHHRGHRDKGAFGEGLVPRVAGRVADAMGTVQFVLVSTVIILAWVIVNNVVSFLTKSWVGLLNGQGFDPAPFILLNLVFSAVAYYSASMVMIAQKTQARRDQAREAADAAHREELAARQVSLLEQNLALTAEVQRLTAEVRRVLVPDDPGLAGR